MTNVYSISNPETANQPSFDEIYKWYPHNPGRKSKAKAKALYNKIIAEGGYLTKSLNRDSGGYDELHLEATPAEILAGVKEYRKGLPKTNPDSYTVDTSYVPAMEVWLNAGRWE